MSAADEQQLIGQAKDGSAEAFRVLVERYMKHAYNVAYSFVNNHDDAEDISQEAFLRVHRSLRSFRGDAAFTTWLYRIIVNLSMNFLNHHKKKTQREVQHTEIMDTIPDNNPAIAHSLDVQIPIEHALRRLTTLQRTVVTLRHLDGLSTKEVSAIMRCSEGTVKTHLHRGLRKMRTALQYLKDGDG